jgi:hypothetical protein
MNLSIIIIIIIILSYKALFVNELKAAVGDEKEIIAAAQKPFFWMNTANTSGKSKRTSYPVLHKLHGYYRLIPDYFKSVRVMF